VHKDNTDPSMPACTTAPHAPTMCPYSTASKWQGWAVVAVGAELALAGVAWRIWEVRRAEKRASLMASLDGLHLVGTF
jgi:hypothetical protein